MKSWFKTKFKCVYVAMHSLVMSLFSRDLIVNYILNKNTWGVKKVRGQEEPATKSSDIK